MSKPFVAIVGRPNVGKSTLFNRIVGSKAAIVEDIPGVTRDRHYHEASWEGKTFIIVDTGGFYPEPSDDIFQEVKEQALFSDRALSYRGGRSFWQPRDSFSTY